MYSVPGRTSCRIIDSRVTLLSMVESTYNASPKPTSEFFNARTLTSIVGHAALLTKGSNERLSSSVVFRHLPLYYSITSTWNYRDSAARSDMNNNRAPHQLSDAHAHTTTKNGLPFLANLYIASNLFISITSATVFDLNTTIVYRARPILSLAGSWGRGVPYFRRARELV